MLYIFFKQVHDNVVVANLRVRPFHQTCVFALFKCVFWADAQVCLYKRI